MQHIIHAFIEQDEEGGYVAECPQLHAVTQGDDLDKTMANLKEVIELALDGEDLAGLGLSDRPVILVRMEMAPAVT